MATREQATMSANDKRMKRNDAAFSDWSPGKPAPRIEQLKHLPRGKAAQQQWRPSKRSKSSGR